MYVCISVSFIHGKTSWKEILVQHALMTFFLNEISIRCHPAMLYRISVMVSPIVATKLF